MRFRRNNREIPELNTTSTADISFMLLVFFLVTSSMGADSGLSRKLAPIDNQTEERQDISRSNVLQVRIDADDRLYCDGQPVSQQQLRQQVVVCGFAADRSARHQRRDRPCYELQRLFRDAECHRGRLRLAA